MLNSRISNLDKDISCIKSKYEIISSNVGKFNKGKEDLNSLLSFQKNSNSRHGLGFSSKLSSKTNDVSYSNIYQISKVKNNYAFLYSRFVKSSKNQNFENYDNSKVSMHKYSPSLYLWIPKNISLIDRNDYIVDYKKNICNSVNYLCKNKGKPNSNWIWFPKV